MCTSVTDLGSGKPVYKKEHLFQYFGYMLEGESRRRVGARSGLSVLKVIIEAHGELAPVEDQPSIVSEF